MKLRTNLIVAGLAVGLLCSNSWGIRIWNPPWYENPSGYPPTSATTSQGWEFGQNLTDPAYVENLFGPPLLTGRSLEPQTVPGPNGGVPGGPGDPVQTWHVAETGGGIDILVPNSDHPERRKTIFVQVTSDKSPLVPGGWGSQPAGTISFPKGSIHLERSSDDGVWYVYTAQFDIPYCPPYEVISINFPASTNIEEVHVDTICFPEPASAGLLLLGGSLLAVCRRRHQ